MLNSYYTSRLFFQDKPNDSSDYLPRVLTPGHVEEGLSTLGSWFILSHCMNITMIRGPIEFLFQYMLTLGLI